MAVEFEDFISDPGAFKALLALTKIESMTFREFTHATGYWTELAGRVRDKLDAWNLISVSWRNEKTQEIRITPYGREVIEGMLAQLKIVERAHRAKNKN